MAEKERPLYTLYKGLKANNYDVPDNYDSFEKTLTEAGNGGANSRHTLYNSLKEQNFDVPDTYEQFYSNLFTPVNKTTSRALGGSVPMSDADKARFSRNASDISAQAGQVVQRFKNTQRASNIKKRQQKKQNDFGRVDLGTKKTAYGTENAVRDDFGIDQATGKVGTYITSSGEEIGNEYEAGQQQQAEDEYNAAYNDAEKSGEIPSSFDVVDKNGNYDLFENVGQNGTHVTEEGVRRQLNAKIADATARLASINARIKEIDARGGNPLLSYSASLGAGSGASTERKQLGLAKTQVENELRSLDAIQKQPDRNWLQNMWQGFSDTALTANAWDFGLNDFAVMGQMERIKAKADNNIPLTNEEKRLAQSKLGADAAAALADEEMGRAYRWSGIAGQSVPFMFDFLVTGGFGGLTHAAGRAAVKFAVKKGMGTLGKNVLKYTGVTAANIVGSYAMAGTEQVFKTGADIMNRHLGTLYQDENGNYAFGTFDENGNLVKDGGEGFGTALYKGLTAAMLENYTEKVFRHTHFKRAASKALSAHFPKFASFLATKGAPKWMKRIGIDGLGEEIMEEEINIPLNALLVGDNKLSDLGDLKQQGDIIFGIGLSVGSMYALKIIAKGAAKAYNNEQYYRFKNKMDNVDGRLQQMMGDHWNEWKDKIDGTPNEEMGAVIREVLKQKQSGSLNEQEINSIGDYILNLAKVRGYNLAKTTEMDAKAATGEETTPEDEHQQEHEQAYSEGQDAEGEEKHEIQMQTAEAEANLASMLGVSVEQLENVDLDSMLGENDQLDLAIYEYQNANARYQGVMDKAQSAVDSAEENARAEVQRRMDASRGTVRNATIKSASNDLNGGEDYGVYIVSGNVATNEDGTINVADSDDMILYFDPLTGKVEHADASRFSSLGEEVDAELTIQQTAELARQDAIAGVTRDIDGKVGEGSRFVVIDNQGQQHIYEVLADNGDGTASISIDGNVMGNVFPSFDELQKMKDDTDKMRVSDYVSERQAEREQQQQADDQEKQKVKPIDWSQLIAPDGTITTATIEGEDKLAFVVGRTPSGKLRVAYLNDDNTVEKRKGLVSPDKVMLGEPIALDEYRQMMGDTNTEQSNNSEDIVDDVSTKEVEDSGETGENGSGIESKVVSDKDFDIDSIDFDNNYVVIHQTLSDNADSILRDGLHTIAGLNGTSLFANRETIEQIIQEQREGRGHKGSTGLVIMQFPKSMFEEGKRVSLDDISIALEEKYGPDALTTVPPEYISNFVLTHESNAKSSENVPNEEKEAPKFSDGTPIPLDKDGEADFSQMTPEQAVEWYDTNLGDDAQGVIDANVASAKKALDKAQKVSVKPAKPSGMVKARQEKQASIDAAQAAYDNAVSVSNAYNEMLLGRALETPEGRKSLLDKAKAKFDRLKNKDEWKNNQQALWNETIGNVLHRLYDGTGINVFDPVPLTIEEYVSSSLVPYSLNYEGTETSKGVKQETGLERKDFAKSHVLAAKDKGMTVDAFVHKLWDNRPSQFDSATTQDIRAALLSLITSDMNAYDMRNVIQNNRIAEAERMLEDEKSAADNAAHQEEQKENAGVDTSAEEGTASEDGELSLEGTGTSEEQQPGEQPDNTPSDNMPFGEQLSENDLPFSPNDGNQVVGSEERKEMVDKNKVTVEHVSEAFIPKKLQRAIARIAKMMPKIDGKPLKVQYLYSADADGWFDRDTNTLYLALDSSKALQMVFGHEMTHAIKSMNTSAYDELKGLVKEFLGADFDKAVDATEKFYNAHGVNYANKEDFEEEVIADGIGTIINDLNLTKGIALRMSHPLLAAFHDVLMKIRLAFRLSDDGTYDMLTHAVRTIEKAYVDTVKGTFNDNQGESGEHVAFSLREKPEPKKKGVGYKVFFLKDGKLYPPMVANPNGAATPVGVWLDADAAPIAGESKTGRPQVKQGGKGTQGGSGKLAYRPGWHLGIIPYALQFNRKDAEGNKTLFPKDFVFAEVEYAADVDYQKEANDAGINPSGKYQHSLAGLKHLPTDGYYMYRTNPNPETDPWVITGAMKVNRILTRAEQADLVKKTGREPQRIQDGDIVTDEAVNAINQEIANAPKFSLKVYHGSGADFDEFDFDHMGEGAGSQAFGWGGYVTSSKKIGKSYAQSGMQTRTVMVKNNGKWFEFSEDDPMFKAVDEAMYLIKSEGLRGARNFANRWKEDADTEEVRRQWTKVADLLNNHTKQDFKSRYPSHLYEVEIPEDTGKNYLEWEKPLTKEQREKIEGYLDAQGVDLEKFAKNGFKMDMPYQYIHHVSIPMMLRSKGVIMKNIPKEMSKIMSSLGFTGIKYPAGTIMGGAEKGDTNYVIFDPKDIKIAAHTKFSIRTYHGSQASFDKFDHSFMGSGEGAQAYGWGTYVSEVEGIAKAYAKQNAAKHSDKNRSAILQAMDEYNSAKRDVDDTQYDLNITKDLLKQFQDKLDNAKKNNRQNWIKEFEQRVQSSKEDIAKMEDNLEKYRKVLEEKKKQYDDTFEKNASYRDIEIKLDKANYFLDLLERDLKEENEYVDLYQKHLEESKKELEKAKANGLGVGVDMYEYDVEHNKGQLEYRKGKAETIKKKIEVAKGNVAVWQKKLDSMEKPRNLYTVEIPDDTGDNYLGWDEPLTAKQKDMWRNAAISLAPKGEEEMYEEETEKLLDRYTNQPLTGEKAYKYLTANNTPKKASLALKDAGFDGVKVIAQRNTGGNKDGRMNYVIFDENNAKIVNHTKFSLRETNEKFNTDLDAYIKDGTMPENGRFELGMPSKVLLDSGFPMLPISMRVSLLNKKAGMERHPFEPLDLRDMVNAIQKPIAVFEYSKPNMRNLIIDLTRNGKHFLVGVTLDYRKGEVAVNSISGLFPKENHEWIKWIQDGKAIRIDQKEKVLSLINSLRTNPEEAERIGLNLDSAAKIVKDFGTSKENREKFSLMDEKAKIVSDAKKNGTYLKAPNGKDSKLSEEQWATVRTDNFKKWFGDWEKDPESASKVVDENGEPMVVYHGRSTDFNTFERKEGVRFVMGLEDKVNSEGFFFTPDYEFAAEYASNASRHRGGKANIVPCFLDIRKPMDLSAENYDETYEDVTGWEYQVGMDSQSTLWDIMDEEGMADKIKAKGYDGAIFVEEVDDNYEPTQISYCALDSNQIKSADNNNGDFSSGNNDIRFSLKDPDKTMFGMHNISVDKLRKAIKQGGFAAPSMGVVDSKNGVYSDYGEITLIPKAEKLDKRKGKNAGTFTADAWTPTYPQVTMRQTKEGKEKLYTDTLLNDAIPKELGKNLLNRWESYINTGASRPSEFAWQYMFEKGMNPKVNYSKSAYPKSISNKVMEITDNGVKRMKELTKEENGELIKLYNAYLEKKGEGLDEKAVNEIIGYLEEWKENEKVGIFKDSIQRKIDYFKEFGGDINKAQDWAWKEVVPAAKSDGKVNHAMTLYYATIKADSDKKMQADLQKWFDGKLQEYGMEESLYNGETPSGKPKYVPNTVENAVKIMKKQGLAGGYNDFAPGVGAFIAKYAPTANTLAAMKKNRNKLIPSGDERHKEVRDMILNGYNDLARSLTIKPSDAFDDSGTYRMQELADVKPKDLKKYIADNWNKEVSDGWVERYNELVDTIKNDYPVYYFETKFMRPYGLDEFEKAIVPKNTPTDVMDALKKAGIDVHTYDGKEDREKVTMDAINDRDDIMFSLRYSDYEKSLADWKKRNGLPKDAKRPEMPQQLPNESKFDFMKRVNKHLGEKALWNTAPTYEGHLLFSGDAVGYLNSELQRGSVLARIAVQDSMHPIRIAQDGIMRQLGLDKIGVGEDAYTAENRSHGKAKNEFEEYNQVYLQPLRKAYYAMKKALGDSYDNVKVYMMSKHGLERNAFIAFRDALKKDFTTKQKGKKDVFDADGMLKAYNGYKSDVGRILNDANYAAGTIDYATYRQNDDAIRTKYAPSYPEFRYDNEGNVRDYAGLSALYSEASDFEVAAAENVKSVEDAHGVETMSLWDATNAATKKILKDSYRAGMMGKSVYDYVRDMYNNYIPLRGWDGTSADQVWDYIGGGRGAFNQTMKKAGGRKSIADDPIAYIENMAESGILLNNKNYVKQHLLLLAENHPTDLLTVNKAWYVKSKDAFGNDIWTIASPNIPADMTDPGKIRQAIAQFDKDMRDLEEQGEATQKRGHLDIEYPQTNSEAREHEVRVLRDGEEYVIYVNGDPQLAQAMNNARAQRVRENQSGILDRGLAWLGRKMAAAYTSLSPLFIPANFTRDLTMTLASTAIREDARYNYLLRKNFLTNWNSLPLVMKYQSGKLRQKVEDGTATKKEQMFYDFMMNGGETGFVSTMEVEDFKRKIQEELKDMDRMVANPKRIGHAIMDTIELLNRAIEDSNRFLVYMTSIEYGRPIEEAINNAKDVTLNFNRKGTGEYGWQMVRNLYLFINPAIQSLQTLGALAKHHPYKFTAVTSLWLASGVLVPAVNNLLLSMFGGDDDKDKYWSFTKWDRRNNFIMWIPFTKNFVKIPLAQEFRGFYAVGDMIASMLMGGEKANESWGDYAQDFLGQVVDMLPLDPTGYDGNVAISLMPNAIRPFFELAFNVDFTGKPLFKDSEFNKYDPNFTKAYAGTPDWLVRTSRFVNSLDNPYPDVQQNAIDRFGNPRYNLNNPAVVDHVLSSYLGGVYTFGSQSVGVLTKALNSDSEVKMADIPLLSRFAANPDDRPVSKKQGDVFWDMKEQQDRTKNTLSKLKKEAKVSGDYSTLEYFFKSDQYAKFKKNEPKIKQYEENKKKENAEKDGEEYKPHKTTGGDIYKKHTTSNDDFEDMKMDLLWKKVSGFKTAYDGMVALENSQSEAYYNQHSAAIDAADEASTLRSNMNELKKGMLTDDGKDGYNAKDMNEIRELRKQAISILENAAKTIQKGK